MPLPSVANFPSFLPGKQMLDGDVAANLIAELFSSETGITAFAGGGQASATQLNSAVNVVSVIATNADSVKLPPAVVGREITVVNSDAAQSLQVFGYGTDTINGVATGTGVAQAAGVTAIYKCVSISAAGVGAWFRTLSA